jgi:protocatechuate 3,4-dioxygenase beta subunit
MDNDDKQMGRILSRRDVLKLLGITGATLLVSCAPGVSSTTQAAGTSSQPTAASTQAAATSASTNALPACVVRPEVTEGPYYVAEELNRSDVRSDPSSGVIKDGLPLTLKFNVSQVGSSGCTPLAGAKVEIWHCDADGVYSDVSDPNNDTRGQKFLRGYQETDANGQATFITIYPGWYPGRTVHIHFKVHHDSSAQSVVFTSQVFFDDAVTDKVFTRQPYASRGQRNTLNSADGIYKDELLLTLTESGKGYVGVFDIGMQMS